MLFRIGKSTHGWCQNRIPLLSSLCYLEGTISMRVDPPSRSCTNARILLRPLSRPKRSYTSQTTSYGLSIHQVSPSETTLPVSDERDCDRRVFCGCGSLKWHVLLQPEPHHTAPERASRTSEQSVRQLTSLDDARLQTICNRFEPSE